MKKYIVLRDIIAAAGHQGFLVEAENAAAAIEKYKKFGGELVENEVEVLNLAEPEIDAVEEIENEN
jgi:hypothetical protein